MSISRLAKGVKDENFPGGKAKIEVMHVIPTSCFNWFKYMANMKIGYDNRNIFCLGVKKINPASSSKHEDDCFEG